MPTLKVAQATSPGSQPSQRSYQQSSQRSTKSKAKKVKKVKKIKAHSSPGDEDEILVEAEELTELRTVAEDAAEVVTEDAPEPKEAASGVVALTAETAGMEAASEAVSLLYHPFPWNVSRTPLNASNPHGTACSGPVTFSRDVIQWRLSP